MNDSSLIAQIASAFAAGRPPFKEDLLYKGAYAGDPELEEIENFFGGRLWNSITPSNVFRFRHALSFFSPSALAYYTPAWMTCALVDDEAVDTAIEDLVGTFGETAPNLWTKEQRLAICEWLRHFYDSDLPTLKQRFDKAMNNIGCSQAE